ncbi:OLC1v1031193C1 [Oldenlandia corymbosa var. corymbosa]|uniref:OLC1v1031193C1 n=1 Tax=Oldenlandia corymbosa var. corymbosa TaxID=529605 RepID=A0AAV1CIV9_OLDCO|nr:OLC1v1031193C1 [Oldenlandia corymbosa var. corymbosa]
MGKNDKQDELWDDSALINAFNDAISKYMKMHVTGSENLSADEGKGIYSIEEESISALVDETNDKRRHVDTNEESTTLTSAENEENHYCSTVPEASNLEQATENHVDSSAGPYINQEHSGYPLSGNTEDYNHLVNKYYELEDQRQKILQQLNQLGYWNNTSGPTTVTSQELQASQAYPAATCSLCPYGCQSWVTPCNSSSCYCVGGTSVSTCNNAPAEIASAKNVVSTGDTDFVKTAMVAAEKALTSLKNRDYINPSSYDNEGKEKQLETGCNHAEKSTSSETDLTVVLNAWYSAGFYTGKYLSEQSSAASQRR